MFFSVFVYSLQVLKRINLCFLWRDIRNVKVDETRIRTFDEHAEKYFNWFHAAYFENKLVDLPYMHYLRNHVGELMVVAMEMFGFGYGYFNCNAGEHLNKIIKTQEMANTNLSPERFAKIIRNLRIKQFIYPESIIPTETTVKCSACGQHGHNRKNNSCPNHESHIDLHFSDSEGES